VEAVTAHRRDETTPSQKQHSFPQPSLAPIVVSLLLPRDRQCMMIQRPTKLSAVHQNTFWTGWTPSTAWTSPTSTSLDYRRRALAPLTAIGLPMPSTPRLSIRSLYRTDPISTPETALILILTRHHHHPPETHRSRLSSSRQLGPMAKRRHICSDCTDDQPRRIV
jgi:hypothetical protein